MSIRITRPRFQRSLNEARCELAEARARAAASLAKMHRDDGMWLGWLAREHYGTCLEKWKEYLRAEGEDRMVARYEFLINLKVWLGLLPLPVTFERDSYQSGNLYIAGFFGEDAFVVSQSRSGKRYRLLTDSVRVRRNDPYLRFPGSERFILPDGDDVGIIETANSTRDRLVCLHDAFVLLAVTKGDSFRFRFVGANDKYPVFPSALEKDLPNFVGMTELVERIKREIRLYGDDPDQPEVRIDTALCAAQAAPTIAYKPREGSKGTVSLTTINQAVLDDVDPFEAIPSISKRRDQADTLDVRKKPKAEKHKETQFVVAPEKKPEERTTAKRVSPEDVEAEDPKRGSSNRITSRKVITNAISKADLDARHKDRVSKQTQAPKKGLTKHFEGILDEVDPTAARPQLQKEVKGETAFRKQTTELAEEFLEAELHPESIQREQEEAELNEARTPPSGTHDTGHGSNRVISNFSKRSAAARGGQRTKRPSGEVTTAVVRDKIKERNRSEYHAALQSLQGELDRFFDDHDEAEGQISTSLHSRRSTTEILQMQRSSLDWP
ncbi:MAG: hypothetical protein KDB07_05925 [Planctomycetes bacterium]|nr:hypothetical protein [Planctomycetota bacterium]